MKLIKKNFKSNNVLKIWLVSFIIIPLFIFVMKFAWSNTTDRFVFTWLFLIIGSITTQFFMNVFRKIKSGKFQYLFILIVMNVTMFLTYVLKYHTPWMDGIESVWVTWFGDLLVSVVISLILFVIKTLVWMLLMIKWKELEQKDQQRILLQEQKALLEEKHQTLKEKYEQELEDKKQQELEEQNSQDFKELNKQGTNEHVISEDEIEHERLIEKTNEIPDEQLPYLDEEIAELIEDDNKL